MYDEAEVQKIKAEFDLSVEDVEGDHPDVETGYEIDLAASIARLTEGVTEESRLEFLRREFGYVPFAYSGVFEEPEW